MKLHDILCLAGSKQNTEQSDRENTRLVLDNIRPYQAHTGCAEVRIILGHSSWSETIVFGQLPMACLCAYVVCTRHRVIARDR